MATGVTEDEDGRVGFDDDTMRMLSENLPDNIFRNPDPRIQMAAIESERTQQLMPVLKEELRLRILTKRMERGEPELETTHSPKTYELTEEELDKRERRKEQNRAAARRCREKRKMKTLDEAEKFDNNRDVNDALKKEIEVLEKKQRLVEQYFNQHIRSGCCKMESNVPSTPVRRCQYNQRSASSSSCCSSSSSSITSSSSGNNMSTDSINANNFSSSNSNTSSRNNSSNIIMSTSTPTAAAIVGVAASSSQALPPTSPLTPLSPNSPIQSLSPTSPNAISPELLSPHQSYHQHHLHQHLHHHHQHHHPHHHVTPGMDGSNPLQPSGWPMSLASHRVQTSTILGNCCTSPKSSVSGSGVVTTLSAMPRPHVSRASSTTSLPPPPPSPCPANQSSSFSTSSSSSLTTLTPPPSVSSEFNIIPESPSFFTTMSGFDQSDLSVHLPPDHLMADMSMSLTPYTTQLSPGESIASSSPNINMIVYPDRMFDDDDDDDDNHQKVLSSMVPWDKLA